MILLTVNVGKVKYSHESNKTMEFMIQNQYLVATAQKAYIDCKTDVWNTFKWFKI